MTDWADRVSGHPVMGELTALSTQMEDAGQRAMSDAAATRLFARMRATEKAVTTVLSAADPLLVSDAVLNGLLGNIQAWRSQLSAYNDNGNAGHLQNAMGNVDGVLTLMGQIPTIATNRPPVALAALRGYGDVIQRYTNEVEQRQADVQSRAADLATRIQQLGEQVVQIAAQVQSASSLQQQQFSEKQEERLNEFGRSQQERASTFNALVEDIRTAAELQLSQEEDRFEEFKSTTEARFQELVASGNKAALDFDAQYRGVADKLVGDLEARKKEADKLVGIIAERGVTSHYQKVANGAWRTMVVWQIVTVLALGGLLIGAIFEFIPAMRGGWSWGVFAGRLFVTVAVGLLAGYAGTEARESQKVMRENRQREMDLAAVGPYLESLPEAMRQEFLLKLAERTFTPPIEVRSDGAVPAADGASQAKVIESLVRIADAASSHMK